MPTFGICLGHQMLGARLGRARPQDEVRPPRRQPPGAGPRHRPRADHQPEPRLRGRREDAAGQRCGRRTCRCSTARCRASRAPTGRRSASRATPKRARARTTSATCSTASSTLMDKQRRPMPKRTDIKSILIIGAGPIVIGQACEFDYSGAQACKALREEGYRVILVNSQPGDDHDRPGDGRRDLHRADHLADGREDHRARSGPTRCCRRWAARPRSTARSTSRSDGVLEKYGVEMIGATREAIDKAEDREKFKDGDDQHRPRLGRAPAIAHTLEEALQVQATVGFPAVIRPVVHAGRHRRRHRLQPGGVRRRSASAASTLSPTNELLIEESLHRLERVRDGGGARQGRTTASSSARSRTSTRWACTPATRSRWRRRRR